MLKEISEPFNVLPASSVSGTSTVTSSASSVKYKDSVVYQINATSGVPDGTFYVNASVDYNPGNPQSAGTYRAGHWYTLTSQVVGSGTSYPVSFRLTQVTEPWLQIQFVSSTSSGTIEAWFMAKSLG